MKTVKSIAIVGGGSSGWMTAAYLSHVLFDVRVTLIESTKTPTIGVGEATVPSLTRFMTRLGYPDYRTWLRACDGTIKTGISFRNWVERGARYWHPFEGLDYVDDHHHTGHCWMARHRRGEPECADVRSYSTLFHASETLNHVQHRGPVGTFFAYHLNADQFGELLRRTAVGVTHIRADVVDVPLDDQGEIRAVVLDDGREITADLFIDCTGFRRRLIRQVDPHQRFESYAASLFCDRAVVLRFPYRGTDEGGVTAMRPYVTADARSAGWIWKIPLYSRISSGYVYSSSFLSDDEAEAELRAYWGPDRLQDAVPHKVKFETGKLDNIWVKNCVAVGLSGGFIEPLESTGLAITQAGIEMLASIIDARCYDEWGVARYNMHLGKFCRDIVLFIISHYKFTTREDTPFWQAVRHDTQIPDDLAARLDTYRRLLPTLDTRALEELWCFRDFSWFAVLLGMRFPFDTPHVSDALMARADVVRQKKAELVAHMQSRVLPHDEFMKKHVYERDAASVLV